ncbi:hypothetical protein N8569_00910 [bacterium]|nr:hypothetical protein [bacterium]
MTEQAITPETPVSEAEVDFLSNEGWHSGFGWETGLDWWMEPSYGEPISIESDASYMARWLSDREAFAHKCLVERAREHAMELFSVCREVLNMRDDKTWGTAYLLTRLYSSAADAVAKVEHRD